MLLYNTLKMDQICNCSFYWFDLWIKYSQESFTKKTLTPTEHHNIYLMDLSDVLYSSVLPDGFIRYFSDNRHGILFQPLTPIITPWRTKFFFKAIWWIQPLSETEWSEGVLRFCNSVCTLWPVERGKGEEVTKTSEEPWNNKHLQLCTL